MRTVTGVFEDADTALRVGEQARELAGPRATVRVFLAGGSGSVIETSIIADKTSWLKVTVFGIALGVLGAVVFQGLGASWGLGLVGLLTGALTGVMLGVWLTGELYPRRIMAARGGVRFRYEQQMSGGRAVVTTIVPTWESAEMLIEKFEREGGQVIEGFLHEQQPPTNELQPIH